MKFWEKISSLKKCVQRQRIKELKSESQGTLLVKNEEQEVRPDEEAE